MVDRSDRNQYGKAGAKSATCSFHEKNETLAQTATRRKSNNEVVARRCIKRKKQTDSPANAQGI